ncbi:TPA: hypothetical protein QIB60_004582 [Enterobacter cloacae subsp. dissolvens]|nr:hypothetical protein [Enterobacter cloacae]HDT0661884.1 hypothetical protein [Enterobacter cloacae subsp. dissolvens]
MLYDYRHVAIPLLVYSCELTIWAVLNRNGIGDYGWRHWRIALLVSLFLLVVTSEIYSKNDIGDAALGVISPWLVMLLVIIVLGFIRMSLDFVTIDMFFFGVFSSGAFQFLLAVLHGQRN